MKHNKIKKILRLTIIGAGGEFTAGVVTDQGIKEKLRKNIDDFFIKSFMEFNDGTYFEASNYTSILHCYGPNVTGSKILLEESFDFDAEDDYERDYEEILFEEIDETAINQFTSSNPYADSNSSYYADDNLIFYSQKIEKRIHYPVVIQINHGEEFDLSNVYLGSMNMDETISGNEIIEDVLFIPQDKAEDYTREYLGDEWSSDSLLGDFICEIYSGDPELKVKIRTNHSLYPEDVEGKGEWENDYVKVTSLYGELLFENGIY